MDRSRAYLDYNASAPLRDAARAAMAAALDLANPSSVHAEGRVARAALEAARADVAALADAPARHAVFTSGGTEAAAMALRPNLVGFEGPLRLLLGATEHPAVREGHGFPSAAVEILPVDPDGRLRLDALEAALRRGGPAVLSL
ncbi:MAG: aminotransferase class V-fold PLP-dependent enzyme, partial [Hyphomicrobiales bacterium]|nr:aminotransferase class V-fold PLP-dependent enzyme [Hyphomicrobiales bacterium]